MDANADNAAEEIHRHPPPEVSVTRHSPTESVVQALVADQSILSTLSQAIVSVIKEDLPGHAIDQSRAEKAAAPVGQSAEQSAVESVDQTGKVKATKRRLPIDVVVIDENTQSKRPRGDKSTSYASSLQADQSSADEDNDLDGLLSPNSRWEPGEELDTLLKALKAFTTLRAKNNHSTIPKASIRGSLHSQLRQLSKFHDFWCQNSR